MCREIGKFLAYLLLTVLTRNNLRTVVRQESIEKVNEVKNTSANVDLHYKDSTLTADMLNALWLDPFSPPSNSHREVLFQAGINLLSVVTLEDLKKTLKKTNLIVIRIKDNLSLFEEVSNLTKTLHKEVPIICRVDKEEFELGISAMRAGAVEVLSSESINPKKWKNLVNLIDSKNNNANRNSYIFVDPESQKLLALAEKVAKAEVTALLTGPTGAGKEVLARILHDASKRNKESFVSINCGAIPENLMEDLLFGHEKGAFTGAHKEHRGVFEQANNGTLFLDEIGELPCHLQTKLLRVLQERVVTRLGGATNINVDFRLVAATNKNLREAIKNREFREDLYFRISTFRLKILPLTDRPKDILPLIAHIISCHTNEHKTISIDAQSELLDYSWPGNVRELDNVIQRALVLCSGSEINTEHLIFDEISNIESDQIHEHEGRISTRPSTLNNKEEFIENNHISKSTLNTIEKQGTEKESLGLTMAVKTSEFKTIMSAIQTTSSRTAAAKKLGISPRTLRYKIAQLKNMGIPELSFD
jgi:two-component system response regulator FlrC